MKMWKQWIVSVGMPLAFAALPVHAAQDMQLGPATCGEIDTGGYGPFDYRTDKDKLRKVERFHFTYDVENLIKGNTTFRIGGDISYTLRRFPNHHRALHAMARLALREKTPRPEGSAFSIDCWFERASRFRPDDAVVPMIYAIYLTEVGKKAAALQALESAEERGSAGPSFHYNMGLVYADLGRYDRALEHAHRAYAMGYNLPGLKAKLQRAGQWRDAPAAQEAAAPASD